MNCSSDREKDQEKSKKLKTSDQMNIRGVYLHILGDALGSVIVICSALAIHFGSGAWTLYVDPGMRYYDNFKFIDKISFVRGTSFPLVFMLNVAIVMLVFPCRDACVYLKQGGKASSEDTSLYVYVPPQRCTLVFKLFSRKTMFCVLVS